MGQKLLALPGIIALTAAAPALAGCGGGGEGGDGGGAAHEILLQLEPVGADGATGEASLSRNGDRTNVFISLIVPSGGGEQVAAIHKGTCANPAAEPTYKLPNLQEGTGGETLDVQTQQLLDGDYAIVVRKSPQQASVTIACAEITGG